MDEKINYVEITISMGYKDGRSGDMGTDESSTVINFSEDMVLQLPDCELTKPEMVRRVLELWISLLPDREW